MLSAMKNISQALYIKSDGSGCGSIYIESGKPSWINWYVSKDVI